MTDPRSNGGGELLEKATDFELIVQSGEKYCDGSKRLSRTLSLFFAMRSAFAVRMSVAKMGRLTEVAEDDEKAGIDYIEQERLPAFDDVKSARQRLAAAVAAGNRPEMTSAVAGMGIFALCPAPDKQLSRMERLAETVSGRARLVFLVELSLFALELTDFEAARRYVNEAWGLDPSAWELYNLCVLEGLFALDGGKTRDAVQWLEKSINACQTDEHTSLYCGVRPPNFLLVQRLLEQGERMAVLRHLTDCRNVWQLPRMPMEGWINLIECGKTPDFQESGLAKGMNQPSCRLFLQWRRARSLENGKGPSPGRANSKSPEEVVEARKKLAEDLNDYMGGRVANAIRYLDKELESPPNRPPRNPTEPDEPE